MNLFHNFFTSVPHTLFVLALFSIVLGIMVLIHEFGHFLVAKMCGVRIETFAIGFGPRIVGYVYNGTDYCLRALPLGGYVKMAGEMGGESNTGVPDEFTSKTRFQRILIALAGPAANFALSIVLMTLAAHYHHEIDKYLNGSAVVDYVPTQSAAAHAGLRTGDTITRFNNVVNPNWEQILDETALNLNADVPIAFTDHGQTITSTLHIAASDPSLTSDPLTDTGLLPQRQANPVVISSVAGDTPAQRAGLQPGDQIVLMDKLAAHSLDTVHAYLKDQNGAPETLQILRDGKPLTVLVTPAAVSVDPTDKQFQLGVTLQPPPVDIVQLPLGKAIHASLKDNGTKSLLLVRIVKGLFTRHVSVKQMSGPVGIAQQIDIAFQLGFWTLVEMTSFISINLAIFNLLPFPPLDGGMIFFLLVESIMRRDVNQQLKERVYQIAFIGILCMFAFVMFNDITRLHLGH